MYVVPLAVDPLRFPAPLTMLQLTAVLLWAPETVAVNACELVVPSVVKFFGESDTDTVVPIARSTLAVAVHDEL